MLLENFHRDTVSQIMRLELGVADHPAVDLAEPPDATTTRRRERGTRFSDSTGVRTWRAFLRAHWGAIAAADFFTTEVWTSRGLVTYYTLFVLDLKSRGCRSWARRGIRMRRSWPRQRSGSPTLAMGSWRAIAS